MAKPPRYSVVVPLYNKEHYLLRALNSILNQTQSDFEVIIVDDGSTDGSAELAKTIDDPRVRLVQQVNAGVSAARNRGIRESRAQLVAFLDADDEWLPGFLSTIDRLIERYPEAGAYATATWFKKESGLLRRGGNRAALGGRKEGIVTNFFRGGHILWACSAVVRAEVLARVGTFNETMNSSEDQHMWFRIAAQSSFGYTNDAQLIYHLGIPNSLTRQQSSACVREMIKTGDELLRSGIAHEREAEIQSFLQSSLRNAVIASAAAHQTGLSRELAEVYVARYPGSSWTAILLNLIAHPRLCRTFLFQKRLASAWSYLRDTYLMPPGWLRKQG